MEFNFATGITLWFVIGLALAAISHIMYIRERHDKETKEAADRVKDALGMIESPLLKAFAVVFAIMLWPYFLFVLLTK